MVPHILHRDRPERPKADVQGEGGDAHPPALDARQELRREVQTGRRRGHRAVRGRVNRLIILGTAQRFVDVRGYRHLADLAGHLKHWAVAGKSDQADSFRPARDDLAGEVRRQRQACSDPHPTARPQESLPYLAPAGRGAIPGRPQEQYFHRSAGVLTRAQPRRNDPCVVDGEHICRPQVLG